MLRRLKALISRGGDLPLGAARQMERSEAEVYYQGMTPADFEAMQTFLMARRQRAQAKL